LELEPVATRVEQLLEIVLCPDEFSGGEGLEDDSGRAGRAQSELGVQSHRRCRQREEAFTRRCCELFLAEENVAKAQRGAYATGRPISRAISERASEALLERRMGREKRCRSLLHRRRDDEEGVHRLDLSEVALGNPEHVARDLLQRAHQVLRRAGDQRGAAIGRELAVARDGEDEDLAEEVGHDGHEQDDQPDRNLVVVTATATPEHPAVEPEAGEQTGEHREKARDGHDQGRRDWRCARARGREHPRSRAARGAATVRA